MSTTRLPLFERVQHLARTIAVARGVVYSAQEQTLVAQAQAALTAFQQLLSSERNFETLRPTEECVAKLDHLVERAKFTRLPVPPAEAQRTWTVQGSKGETHILRDFGGVVSCSCKGWHYRATCSHVATAKGAA